MPPWPTRCAADDRVVVLGEDVGRLGGVFRVTDGLQARSARTAASTRRWRNRGSSGRPSAWRCTARARSSRCSSTASATPPSSRSSATSPRCAHAPRVGSRFPMVVRIPYGGGIGAVEHHSESPEAYFAHTAGSAGRDAVDTGRRVLAVAGVDRVRRPRDLPRAEAALLREGRRRPAGADRADRHRGRAPAGHVRHRDRLRARGAARARDRRRGRGGRLGPGGRRRPLAQPARHRDARRERAAYGEGRDRARGTHVLRLRRRDRRAAGRAGLRVVGGPDPARRRVRRAVPAARIESLFLPDVDRVLDAVELLEAS